MKKIFLTYLIFSFLVQFSSCKEDDSKPVENKPEPVAQKVPLGDPFIMLWENTYYAYGTYSPNGIAVFTSDDLQTWQIPEGAVGGIALNKKDVWADRWFWAPEVYHVNDKFYMYYSADEHICVATSDSPLGPFKQDVIKPMIENEKCIDNSLYIDDDGKPYLTFVRFNDGNNIWIAEMEEDLKTLKMETMVKCINVSQNWEKVWPRVNEGSFITKHNGVYYMTYSANSYESHMYGVGVATASNVMGPWVKYDNNPLFQKPGDLVGVGHSAMFADKDGKLRKVFHAHNSINKIHPRNMYITTVEFVNVDGKEVITIGPEYITPVLE